MKTRHTMTLVIMVLLASLALLSRTGAAEDGVGGTITGKVIFNVEIPAPERVKVTRDAEVCGGQKVSEEFIVSSVNHGLKNVVVMLSGIENSKPDGGEGVRLDQQGCMYHPHVQATTVGARLTVTNSDQTFHNVHAYHVQNEFQKPTLFNVAQPAGSDAAKQAFDLDKAGVVEFNCDVHPWMKAYIIVCDNPYFAVTDANGEYTISAVPPGEYVVRVWHEGLGEFEDAVTVESGATVKLNFPIEENE